MSTPPRSCPQKAALKSIGPKYTRELRPQLSRGRSFTVGETIMKVGLAGQGAFGVKHLEAIQNIPGIEVITITGGTQTATEEVAKRFKIPHFTGDLGESLKQPGLEAMILATPTQMH